MFLCLSYSPSSAVSSCHNRVYQSLANLIRWADQVMLEGIDLDDKETVATVTAVIKAVLDGVKVWAFVSVFYPLPVAFTKTTLYMGRTCVTRCTSKILICVCYRSW